MADAPNVVCRKCGRFEWGRPKYRLAVYADYPDGTPSQKVADECLVWTCHCGYAMTTPTDDQARALNG